MANFDEDEILHILNLTSVTLVKVKGHMTLPRRCPLDTCILLWNNHPDIYLHGADMGESPKIRFSWPLTSRVHRMTSKSIGSVLDLYPTILLNTIFLCHSMSEKSGRQTDRHTHRQTNKQTDGANHSIVAHFVRGNYNYERYLNIWLSNIYMQVKTGGQC